MRNLLFGVWAALSMGGISLGRPAYAGEPLPWWRTAVVYEIFTRSFSDSNGDGIGDLAGVESRLDYLEKLGVTAIWLTPIYPSPSYHGYDTTNYQDVSPLYGDLGAIRSLISSAHSHGIRVILDIAINHTSIIHPWFLDPSLKDEYIWSPQPLEWSAVDDPLAHWHKQGDEYYYSTFSTSGGMADLNWRNADVLPKIQQAFDFWTDQGVDGFRLDAAGWLVKGPNGENDQPETHAIWQSIVRETRAKHPDTFFVGEVWSDESAIATYQGTEGTPELDQCFDFPVAYALVRSLQNGDAGSFNLSLDDHRTHWNNPFFGSPIVTNHDQTRIATQVDEDPKKLALAAMALFTLPGTPYVYYGEEIGMPNGKSSADEDKRTPMLWTKAKGHGFTSVPKNVWRAFSTNDASINVEAQDTDPSSLLNLYRNLIALHKSEPALYRGEMELVRVDDPGVAAFTRTVEGETMITVINFSNDPVEHLQLKLPAGLPAQPSVAYNTAFATADDAVLGWDADKQSLDISQLAGESAILIKAGSSR